MSELNILFQPVGQYCRREVITCGPDDPLVAAVATMRERNISSLVTIEACRPVGIITDRDLRNKVVALGRNPAELTVRQVMSSPLITIAESEFLFEALHLLSRHRIHRLAVTGPDNELAGIITDSDILRIQTRSPQQLVREIEEADGLDQLAALHKRVQGLVEHLVSSGVPISELVRLIAHLNDRIMIRLTELVRSQQFPDLTDRFALLVLGSEGRGEQTLTTDQDNALVYADDLSEQQVQELQSFSEALIEAVIRIGIPPCAGGIMANMPQWRHSLQDWRQQLNSWFGTPTPENILKISMVSDMRTLYGDPSLEQALRDQVAGRLVGNDAFLGHMTANLLRFGVPLGWFGRIKTEKPPHSGLLDLKKAGIFAVTEGVKILALSNGLQMQNTRERVAALQLAGLLSYAEATDLLAVYDSLVQFRLRSQVDDLRADRRPDNLLTIADLNRMELGRLRSALEGVRSFQQLLQMRYRLGQLL
jgi:CBS domain-containing protein